MNNEMTPMNTQTVIKSIKIKKLFGKHDLNIDFEQLTIIVGKNGLGKTTLLKIIDGLLKQKNYIDYQKVCESIELELKDGPIICYGAVTDKFLDSITSEEISSFMVNNTKLLETINDILKDAIPPGIENRDELLKSIVSSLAKQENVVERAKQDLVSSFSKEKDAILVNKQRLNKLVGDVNIRYISTVNISANSGNKIDFGNSVEKNVLDVAINEELRTLQDKGSKFAFKSFESQLNLFLKESGKSLHITNGEWKFESDNGLYLNLSQLSSGERQLIYILATAANTIGKPTLFLMDEPEVSLHLSWQEKIIDAIMKINPQMQIIAVTHSPGIVMSGHMDSYVEMNDLLKGAENV